MREMPKSASPCRRPATRRPGANSTPICSIPGGPSTGSSIGTHPTTPREIESSETVSFAIWPGGWRAFSSTWRWRGSTKRSRRSALIGSSWIHHRRARPSSSWTRLGGLCPFSIAEHSGSRSSRGSTRAGTFVPRLFQAWGWRSKPCSIAWSASICCAIWPSSFRPSLRSLTVFANAPWKWRACCDPVTPDLCW